MNDFVPIAIVGRGCILPGANDPATLWGRVVRGDDLTTDTPHHLWGLDPAAVCADRVEPAASARGGYVTGFSAVWRDDIFALPPETLVGIPEGWRWLMIACAQALGEAGIGRDAGPRAGIVLGSLGYATREFADAAAARWMGGDDVPHPALEGQTGALRWTSGACGLGGPRVALDAACASGLYAVKHACDLLQQRRADLMLAAGLNAADDLFLHVGFTALGALSPSGRSHPLSQAADGLLPAEGASVLALKRLDDAVAQGDRILAVIRGVGLSNDGRGPGLLAPTTAGQQRAIRAAWQQAGLDPRSLDCLECHATATPVGDREEVLSLRAVFGDRAPIALGSLKAQLGHLITASAGAGLLKLCGAFEHDLLPAGPAMAIAAPIAELRDSALRLPAAAEGWRAGERPRRAAINAFGFGGCNAHAVLEGPEGARDLARARRSSAVRGAALRDARLAIVAMECAVGDNADLAMTRAALAGHRETARRIGDIALAVPGLGFPPADLRQALPQQLLLLRAAQRLKPALEGLDRARVGVFVGADVDPAGARHGCRWRLDAWLQRAASTAERDAIVPPLDAAGVLGTMPNMPANRVNSALDLGGAGLVVSDGEASGRWALELAAAAIARGELDAALVGAVDASGGAFGDDPTRTDAAVLLLVLRADLVGDRPVIATLARSPAAPPSHALTLPWGDAGIAQELVEIAGAALCCRHALHPLSPAVPWTGEDRVIRLHGFEIAAASDPVGVAPSPLPPPIPPATGTPPGQIAFVFTGAAAAYPGAGRALWTAIPELTADLATRAPRLAALIPRLTARAELSLMEQLQLATLLSQSHARMMARLGVVPQAMIGLSSGETNALLASGAWTDPDALFAAVEESGMYDRHLAGEHRTLRAAWGVGPDAPVDWRCFRVWHTADAVRDACAATQRGLPSDAVRLLVVHHAKDVVIGGRGDACEALIARLGARSAPLGHDLVVHCPELGPFASTWYAVHHRRTAPIATPRIYANALNAAYVPSSDRCAEVILAQARETVEFAATVERAYADGVRVFVEMGPRAACTGWIGEILRGRPHVAVSLDGMRGGLDALAEALRTLTAAGVPVDVAQWERWMGALDGPTVAPPGALRFGAHRPMPALTVGALPPAPLVMPKAPPLAPRLPDRLLPVAAPSSPTGPRAPLVAAAPEAVAPSVLQALADTQAALVQVQALMTAALGRARRPVGRPVAAPVAEVPAPVDTVATATPEPGRPTYPGPSFTREQLEEMSHGRLSKHFGPRFAAQDDFHRQVRMPMPPLLLADRVLGIDAEPCSMTTGTIWTETDVRADSWYLHHGRMPAGILIESGQADLLLISWLGIDLSNRGERVYRLLGCELTFCGGLPQVGDTLHYRITISGHARHGDVGLFFFHSDCTIGGTLRLQVREGQAGFFTDTELLDSAGILWDPLEDRPAAAPLAGPRPGVTVAPAYSAAQVAAFAAGDVCAAFGAGFERAASHTRTPTIPGGRMQLFERVDELDLTGGPWGRGYLRATLPITPDAWFFDGHFHNDPCMPGTLMFEGALQTMAFYLAALGYTIDRDGGVFEPEPGRPYTLRCRGQVTPSSTLLTYEVFVAELHDGPEPMLVADLLCTVDGLKAFHCRRMALRLKPDFPLGARELAAITDVGTVAEVDGFRYGQASLLACATGHPTAAFGPLYASIPPSRRVPRLPAPPYHFISRVRRISHPPGGMQAGVTVETEYDIPSDAWYLDAHPTGQMPACVLIEAALQPCGWLASYVGCAVAEPEEVYFRNLDGKGTLHRAVRREDRILVVRATLTTLSRAGGVTLVQFDVRCTVGDEAIYDLATTFGFFPKAALEGQAGLPSTPESLAWATQWSDTDLTTTLDPAAQARIPAPMLRMCERITHRDVAPDGSARIRGEKTVRADEWFFKAHFFQDPVQPGSLGVEALVQLLQGHLLLSGAATAIPAGQFADLVAPTPGTWQFRGQVLPHSQRVSLTLEVEPIRRDDQGWHATAQGSVWVDGMRIYQVHGLTVSWLGAAAPRDVLDFDPTRQPWWNDHCPTYTVPVVPAMALASAALAAPAPPGERVIGIERLQFRRWLDLAAPRRVRIERDGSAIRFRAEGESATLFADGTVVTGVTYPTAPPPVAPLTDAAPLDDLYASGALFHGPAYHRVVSARRSSLGADAVLRWDPADARERVSHFVLDAALHAVPHDALWLWYSHVAPDQVAYPAEVESLRLYADPPHGASEVRIRPAGCRDQNPRFPRLAVQLLHAGAVWCEFTVVEITLPATRLGALDGAARRAFLRDGVAVPGARLSDESDGVTTLAPRAVLDADWLPGTVDAIYGLTGAPGDRVAQVAQREHAAAALGVHPRDVTIAPDGTVRARQWPLLAYRVATTADRATVTVRDLTAPRVDIARIAAWWEGIGWRSASPQLHALFLAATRQFVRGVRLADPSAAATLAHQPVLLVANHQVAIESVLAGVALPPLLGRPILTLAKAEHRETWVGQLALQLNDPSRGPAIAFVDRNDHGDLLAKLTEMGRVARAGERALLVHVEGTRALRGSQPVETISAVWCDLAVQAGLAIVPLRFARGLPKAGVPERQEFPVGYGPQDLVLGAPILGHDLVSLRLDERRARVLAGLQALEGFDGEPIGDAPFAARVRAAQERFHLDELRAVFLLLQAAAAGWALDRDGLPSAALAAPDPRDPFWAWFLGPAAAAAVVR